MVLFVCSVVIFAIIFLLGRYEYRKSKNEKNALLEEAILTLENNGFKITRRIYVDRDNEIIVDDEHKQIAVRNENIFRTVNYKDIIGYELCEDGGSINQGTMGGSLVGGLLFGVTGAIIGSSGSKRSTPTVSSLLLNIMINDINSPIIPIPFIEYETQKSSATYKSTIALAHEVIAILKYIEKQVGNGTSTAE